MRRVVDDEHVDQLVSAARDHWGDGAGDAGCVVAEAFDEDVRVVVRTVMVAKAVCGLLSARLVVLTDPRWRPLAEAFGAAADLGPPDALVTSRMDRCVRTDIPVVHVHGTGALRAYALFPGQSPGSFGEDLPGRVAEFFDQWVWPNRETIAPSAERTAWRAKEGYQVRTDTERRQLRLYGCSRLRLDAGRPTITVFGHMPGRDTELFEETERYAAADESANWLFLDRLRSGALSANILWSMTDVAVTFGGSDLPAFGVPVVQAGWSEGAACGATHVVRTPEELRDRLGEAVATHGKGETILGSEQRERARLWLWLRRCAADVPTQILPRWELGPDYPRALTVALRHAERDGDPLFDAVRRMWERRDPVLTRFDFQDLTRTTLTPARSAR
ncbi:hypothetical protein ACFFV7_14435 [Nonomuraea spiralis]|uniref:Uncharacterized protein n=1 Tax=Nonomuraea spiralis TaxID=46182 RepID=A0ABV5ICX3_9ACTN|nr:hypothetical protein [Nonomuraea spiralis]GGT20747.1 hypothetical protein GCM10010176_076640 [Nonomuraea spiralis]